MQEWYGRIAALRVLGGAGFVGLIGWLLLSTPGAAQVGQRAPAKEIRFEVLSIRPLTRSMNVAMKSTPSPNGFDSQISLWQAIMVAYGPADPTTWGSVEILKTPNWIGEFYDIKGRVAEADLKAWQSQGRERPLLRSAMRAALKERCKLVIHEQPSRGEIFELVVAKAGPRLKAAVPQTISVPSMKLASGGVMVQTVPGGRQVKTYYGATMQDLADFLCVMSSRTPVRDKTGLTGHYDFTIQQEPPEPGENQVYSYRIGHLGLQIKPGTEPRPQLVIDHIERPTEN